MYQIISNVSSMLASYFTIDNGQFLNSKRMLYRNLFLMYKYLSISLDWEKTKDMK